MLKLAWFNKNSGLPPFPRGSWTAISCQKKQSTETKQLFTTIKKKKKKIYHVYYAKTSMTWLILGVYHRDKLLFQPFKFLVIRSSLFSSMHFFLDFLNGSLIWVNYLKPMSIGTPVESTFETYNSHHFSPMYANFAPIYFDPISVDQIKHKIKIHKMKRVKSLDQSDGNLVKFQCRV